MDNGVIVSVLVATYNPKWPELKRTLNSVLAQQGVDLEIVICDDGSSDNKEEQIREYFNDRGFGNYVIDIADANGGTVMNICRGLESCKGRYIKLISPGDFLYGKDALKKLVDTAVRDNAPFVYGDVIYYDADKEQFSAISHSAHPQLIKPFIRHDGRNIEYNYLIVNDTIHGVSTLVEKDVLVRYLSRQQGRIKFAEDCVYRIMIADGVKVSYCGSDIVCYSFGGGISTTKENKWKAIIRKDLQESDKEVLAIKAGDKAFLKKFNASITERDNTSKTNKLKFWCATPKVLIRKLKIKLCHRHTSTVTDENYIKSVF